MLKFCNKDIGMHDFDVMIFDLAGKIVLQQSKLSQEFINLGGLEEGMYFLKIYKDGQYQSTEKVVIAK